MYKATVVVGRVQLPHKGHLHLIKTALEHGEKVVVILGSAHHARTIKNCFTWEEREQMIRLCLNDEENSRITFSPVRDYYDDEKWYSVVKNKVQKAVPDVHDDQIRVVGFFKDASSAYLSRMPWNVIDAGSPIKIDSTSLRTMLFESEDAKATLAAMSPYVPTPVINYLKSWSVLPFLSDLKDEYAKIQNEMKSYGAKFGLTGDCLIQVESRDEKYVLLVRRGRHPGKGQFAIPGGFFEPDFNETLYQCAVRECQEETQHDIWEPTLDQAFVSSACFDAPNRSVRKNIITMAHFFSLKCPLPGIKGSVDPGESYPVWVKVSELAGMEDMFFDDHFTILNYFLQFHIED